MADSPTVYRVNRDHTYSEVFINDPLGAATTFNNVPGSARPCVILSRNNLVSVIANTSVVKQAGAPDVFVKSVKPSDVAFLSAYKSLDPVETHHV